MKKDIVFKEFPNEKQALSGYDEYTVTKYVLKKGDKNYSGTPFGNYLPLFPVSIFGNFKLVRKKGWMCKVIDKGTFKILLNSNLSNIYLKCNSDSSYLGIEYVSSDLGYSKLNQIQFVEEYLDEVSKMEETDEFEIQHKKSF